MSNNEQVMESKEDVVARSYEGSVKQLQFALERSLTRTLSPRKPKSAAKPPKFRSLEKSASGLGQTSYETEIAKKVEQAASAASKPGMKRLDRLGKFRFKSSHLDFDISSISV